MIELNMMIFSHDLFHSGCHSYNYLIVLSKAMLSQISDNTVCYKVRYTKRNGCIVCRARLRRGGHGRLYRKRRNKRTPPKHNHAFHLLEHNLVAITDLQPVRTFFRGQNMFNQISRFLIPGLLES